MVLGAMPAAGSEAVGSAEDLIFTGAYSDDWVAAGDLGRLSQIGSPLPFGGTFHHPGEGASNTYWILERVWQAVTFLTGESMKKSRPSRAWQPAVSRPQK